MTKDTRGFILITSYMVLAVISIFSIALFARGATYLESAERNQKKMIAFNAAEAGFDAAYQDLADGTISSFPWTSGYVSLNTGNLRGGYSVTVADMGNSVRQILVTGYSPDQSTTVEAREVRTVNGYVQPVSQSPFNFALFSENSIQMSGNARIDSYNSDDGAYGGSNVAANGDIGSDGTLQISGNVYVNGNSYSTSTTASGNAEITGTTYASTGNVSTSGNVNLTTQTGPTPGLDLSPATTNLASAGALSVSGNNTYNLQAGTYRFSSISVSGNGRINALGAVTIYVDGAVSISGNGFGTSSNKPPNMLVYLTGSGNVSMSGNANFYGAIYAPASNVTNTGNGELYGAVVAKTYQQSGNGRIHYDEALNQVGGSDDTSLELLSWAENNPAAATNISSSSSYSS